MCRRRETKAIRESCCRALAEEMRIHLFINLTRSARLADVARSASMHDLTPCSSAFLLAVASFHARSLFHLSLRCARSPGYEDAEGRRRRSPQKRVRKSCALKQNTKRTFHMPESMNAFQFTFPPPSPSCSRGNRYVPMAQPKEVIWLLITSFGGMPAASFPTRSSITLRAP